MMESIGARRTRSSRRLIAAIVAVVGAVNLGYAGWRITRGQPFDSSMPLMVTGIICMGVAAMLLVISSKKP